MKKILQKYRKSFRIIFAFIIVFAVLFIVRIYLAVNVVNSGSSEKTANENTANWNNEKSRNLQKDIYWYEQLLLLSKSDSISMGINLTEGFVQVQLKGTILFQSKILEQNPAPFLNSLNENSYLAFGKVKKLISESANIPKKPLKKVVAPKNESEVVEVKHDSIIPVPVNWTFLTEDNFKIVIIGVEMNEDSTFTDNSKNDFLKYQVNEFAEHLIPKTYTPTLFLWLNDKEARAIYRAVPEKGKVIFKN